VTATVLVVDDSASLRTAMRKIIEEADLDVEVIEAEDGTKALPVAMSGEVDIVLSDIVMPNLDGIGLLRAIRQKHDAAVLPVILVTSQTDDSARDTGFEVGASDYLTRPFSPDELVARIQVQLRLKSLQRELQRAVERHREQASIDELTKLPNRRAFIESCQREIARSRRHRLAMVICIWDIDGLRNINLEVGHRAVDALITVVSELAGRLLRANDILARLSGGTFAVLLPHTDGEQARAVCARLCDTVANHGFHGHARGVTVSAGWATYPGGNLETVDELLNAAQTALDRAKARGPGRTEAWGSETD